MYSTVSMKFQTVLIACFLASAGYGSQYNDDDFDDIFSQEGSASIGKDMLDDFVRKHTEGMQSDSPSVPTVTGYDESSVDNEETGTDTGDIPVIVARVIPIKHQRYLEHIFKFHQSVICGMTIKKETREINISTVFYNYGEYQCDKDGKFILKNCAFGANAVAISEVQRRINKAYNTSYDFTFDSLGIGFCSQVAHKFLYSGALNDRKHIAGREYATCGENLADAAFYNQKLVSCQNRKFKLIGCLFDETFISAKTLEKAQIEPGLTETHKDICVNYGRKYNWIKSRQLLVGHNEEIDDGMTIHIARAIKAHHESVICPKSNDFFRYKLKIAYKSGWYACIESKLKLISCLYGTTLVSVHDVVNRLKEMTGDFIEDIDDIRFCGQLASAYRRKYKSHEQTNIWAQEDFVKAANNSADLAGVYSNFKMRVFSDGKFILHGCLFDHKAYFMQEVQEYYRKRNKTIDPENRDFCFEFGNETMLIKRSDVVRRGGRRENGQWQECSKINRWPNNVIPYLIAEDTEQIFVDEIRRVIQLFEQSTCLKFRELRPFETHNIKTGYIVMAKSSKNCTSALGKVSNHKQMLYYKRAGCIIHEIGHAIGLVHEHTRPDRDQWVKIDYDYLKSVYDKSESWLVHNYYACNTYHANKFPFEFDSIMNYHPDRDGIASRIKLRTRVKNRKRLTECDAKKINHFYNCSRFDGDFSCDGGMIG